MKIIKNPLKIFHYVVAFYILLIVIVMVVFIFMNRSDVIEVDGVISPMQHQVVVPPFSGVIVSLKVDDGDIVKKGDPVIILDSKGLKIELEESIVNLNNIKRLLDFNKVRYDLFNEERILFEQQYRNKLNSIELRYNQGFISKSAYISEKYQLQKELFVNKKELINIEHDILQNENNVALLESKIQNLKEQITDCIIRAEIDGIFIRHDNEIKINRMISPDDMSMVIYGSEEVFAKLIIPESKMPKLETEQKVTIYVNAIPYTKYKVFKGKIMSFKKTAFDQGNFEAYCRVNDPYFQIVSDKELKQKHLMFGMSIKAKIYTGRISILSKLLGLE